MNSRPQTPIHLRRALALIALTLVAICAAVWIAAATQRHSSAGIAAERAVNTGMLVSMLDQETGVRGYVITSDPTMFDPYDKGLVEFERAVRGARSAIGHPEELESAIRLAREWQETAAVAINQVNADRRERATAGSLGRKQRMDRFRAANAVVSRAIDRHADSAEARTALVPIVLIVVIAGVFGAAGYLLVVRRMQADERQRAEHRRELAAQVEYAEQLALARSDREVLSLLRSHVGIVLPGTSATVWPTDSPERPGVPRLALKAGVEQIGWVEIVTAAPLSDEDEQRLRQSIAQASPALENIRSLACAEGRALTDALTGLPNARAVDSTLAHMAAQSLRSKVPMAALMLDLDRFKDLNDLYGHEAGNNVLAAVGELLRTSIRAGDFVGRFGGEEFTLLLPNTDREGALVLAEKVRGAIEGMSVPGVDREITASIGVAVCPDDATGTNDLLSFADRCLYAAKRNGRNRVEVGAATSVVPC